MSEPPMPDGPMPPIDDAPEPPAPDDGPEPPMDDEPPMDEPNDGENKEIDDIFGKLDTEKQAAVIKYAKSMVNDADEEDSEPPIGDAPDSEPDMPMEGLKRLKSMISEIVNGVLNNEEPQDEADTEDKEIRNTKVTQNNPNISKR